MIDVALKNRLEIVIPFENAWPSMRVSMDQLEDLKRVLESHGIRYWVSENALSYRKGPFMTDLHFYRDIDPKVVQAILDDCK